MGAARDEATPIIAEGATVRTLSWGLYLTLLASPAWGDVIFLKGGQRIEGKVEAKGGFYEITSAQGTITVAKREVKRIVRSLEALEAETQVLHKKARTLYREGIAIEGNVKARNAKLRKAIELLKEVGDMYHEAVEVYTGDQYADLPRTLVKIFQEIRIYRDQMLSELASRRAGAGTRR